MKQVKLVDETPAVTNNMSQCKKRGIKKAQEKQFKLILNRSFQEKKKKNTFQKYLWISSVWNIICVHQFTKKPSL